MISYVAMLGISQKLIAFQMNVVKNYSIVGRICGLVLKFCQAARTVCQNVLS